MSRHAFPKADLAPGQTQNRLKEMLRVDHAGEYAAVAIYRGQHAIFSQVPHKQVIAGQLKTMEEEEQDHLDSFDKLLLERDVRPTALMPLWHVAGYTLGVATALMGEKAAHACTEAVETVIGEHYDQQAREIRDHDPELATMFTQFREDELAHRDFAVQEGAREAKGYGLLSKLITTGCRLAIKVSEKV